MKKRNMPRPVEQSGRRRFGRSQWDHILDPYKRVHKLHEPTVCPQCGAVYHEARWHWAPRPVDAHEELCQACPEFAVGGERLGIGDEISGA